MTTELSRSTFIKRILLPGAVCTTGGLALGLTFAPERTHTRVIRETQQVNCDIDSLAVADSIDGPTESLTDLQISAVRTTPEDKLGTPVTGLEPYFKVVKGAHSQGGFIQVNIDRGLLLSENPIQISCYGTDSQNNHTVCLHPPGSAYIDHDLITHILNMRPKATPLDLYIGNSKIIDVACANYLPTDELQDQLDELLITFSQGFYKLVDTEEGLLSVFHYTGDLFVTLSNLGVNLQPRLKTPTPTPYLTPAPVLPFPRSDSLITAQRINIKI